jgi:hypothetical protein
LNIESIALRKLLAEPDLEVYSKMHSQYFSGAFKTIFKSISEYYAKYGKIPTLEGLKLTTRNMNALMTISSLEMVDVPDVDWDIVIDSLEDYFTQNEALTKIDHFVDSISLLNSVEIKEALGKIVLDLDEQLDRGSKVFDASDITVFKTPENQTARTPIGLNQFDSVIGGAYAEKLYIPGGRRGSGKSILCSNLVNNQYLQGNIGAYFTIEMTKDEVFNRSLCMLAGVSSSKLEKGGLDQGEIDLIMKAKCDMYLDAEEVYRKYITREIDIYEAEHLLTKTCTKRENKLIIIDDRSLSIATIDLELQKLKGQYGDKLQLVVVDYLNQITLDGNSSRDMYGWDYQIQVSKALKNMARKYEVCIVCPIQLDDNNAVRYAKGILDAPDLVWSLNWDKETKQMEMCILKDRFAGVEEGFKMFFDINGSSCRIYKEETTQASAPEPEQDSKSEPADDVPWSN